MPLLRPNLLQDLISAKLPSQILGLAVQAFHKLDPRLPYCCFSICGFHVTQAHHSIIRFGLPPLCLYLCAPSFLRCYLLPSLLNSTDLSNIIESNLFQAAPFELFTPQWRLPLQSCYSIYWEREI